MKKRLLWLVGGVSGLLAVALHGWFKGTRGSRAIQNPVHTAQLLSDASITVKRGLFGQRVKCVESPPPVFEAQSLDDSDLDPTAFPDMRDGHGAFGQWTLDANKLPAYAYELDNRSSHLAYYVNTQGLDRRDHWHQIGNDHITGLAGNDGVVQAYLADRGGIFLNRYAPEADPPRTLAGYFDYVVSALLRLFWRLRAAYFRWRTRDKIIPRGVNPMATSTVQKSIDTDTEFAYAGGYSYLYDGAETWATAYRYRPSGAKTRRIFGIGYFETETLHRDIKYTRWVYAPHGDDPVLISDVEIENLGQSPVSLRCYEYWDVNIHQMRVQWVRSGVFASNGDAERALINSRFHPQVRPELDSQALRFRQQRFAEPPLMDDELAGLVDSAPPEVFLVNLSGPDCPATDYYYDKQAFFGRGNAFTPDAVRLSLAGKTDNATPDDSMPYCLVLRHDLQLAPGEKKTLRFAYGALTRPEQSLAFLNRYSHDTRTLEQSLQAWKDQMVYFSNGKSPVLQWEMTWHAYNLLSATLYSEFYKTHYIPQGSAYLYLHGADGAPRDQALFTLPLVYIRPALARELLILLMGLRNEETLAMPYSFVGNGAHEFALGLHSNPSDLDLFFLLAIAEYLAATGDTAFLQESYPLYRTGKPPTPGKMLTVFGHIHAAFTHLETMGLGPHKLLVLGSGDWDDSIVATRSFNPTFNRERTMREGESIPNSQMALYVLPLLAQLIASHDTALAEKMQALAKTLKEALTSQWDKQNRWFYRAWVWDRLKGNDLIGNSKLSLQSQVWPLISGLVAEMNIEHDLIDTISQNLDNDSPTGAMLEPNGQVWPAVSQLLTWGYCHTRPDLAWRSLNRHTFAVHATVFPSVWFNIWTGPDGTNSHLMPNPGGTWASPVTPMTDLPGMNANQNAMSLLGLLRVCGIEPSKTGGGLDIAPKAPPERYVLRTELLRLHVATGHIAGEYRAANDGIITLHIYIPENAIEVAANLNGTALSNLPTAPGRVDLPLHFTKGQVIPFEVMWR